MTAELSWHVRNFARVGLFEFYKHIKQQTNLIGYLINSITNFPYISETLQGHQNAINRVQVNAIWIMQMIIWIHLWIKW